jgi:hypothetical protein
VPGPLARLADFYPAAQWCLAVTREAAQRERRGLPVTGRNVDTGRVPTERTLGRFWRRHALVRLSALCIECSMEKLQGLRGPALIQPPKREKELEGGPASEDAGIPFPG